jgi:hypothetical protein
MTFPFLPRKWSEANKGDPLSAMFDVSTAITTFDTTFNQAVPGTTPANILKEGTDWTGPDKNFWWINSRGPTGHGTTSELLEFYQQVSADEFGLGARYEPGKAFWSSHMQTLQRGPGFSTLPREKWGSRPQDQGFFHSYGLVEMETQMCAFPGAWPALWHKTHDYRDPTRDVVEFDDIEYYSTAPTERDAHHMVTWSHPNVGPHAPGIWTKDSNSGNYASLKDAAGQPLDLSLGLHKFQTLFTPRGIGFPNGAAIIYLDGIEIARVESHDRMHDPMYLLLSLQLQRNGEQGYAANMVPGQMYRWPIKYVRVLENPVWKQIADDRAANLPGPYVPPTYTRGQKFASHDELVGAIARQHNVTDLLPESHVGRQTAVDLTVEPPRMAANVSFSVSANATTIGTVKVTNRPHGTIRYTLDHPWFAQDAITGEIRVRDGVTLDPGTYEAASYAWPLPAIAMHPGTNATRVFITIT